MNIKFNMCGHINQIVIPKPKHTQWEYKIIYPKDDIHPTDLNSLGNKGWELCGITSEGILYFKRPIT